MIASKKSHPQLINLTMIFLCVYMIFIMHFFVKNMSGDGVNMPQNLLAWIVMTLCVLSSFVYCLRVKQIIFHPVMSLGGAAVLMLLLPAIWDPYKPWLLRALPHLVGVIGALAFSFALLQMPLTSSRRRQLLVLVAIASVVQAFTGLMQAWLPDLAFQLMEFSGKSLPYGIFQQRNVFGSFLATGAGAILWLGITTKRRWLTFLILSALYPIVACLVIIQSRIAVIGMFAMLGLCFISEYQRVRGRLWALLRRGCFIISLFLWAGFISQHAMPAQQQPDFKHVSSTEQRLRYLAGTWELIKQHPVSGNGYGSFESSLPDSLEKIGSKIQSNTVTHPHNEFMYVWAEGGFLGLSGLLLLFVIWLYPVWICIRQRLVSDCLLSVLGLPILMHMMTEFPLYTSVPHLLVLIVLFRAGFPEQTLNQINISRQVKFKPLLILATNTGVILCLSVLVMLIGGLYAQHALTNYERDVMSGQYPDSPTSNWYSLMAWERIDYDRHISPVFQPGFFSNISAMGDFYVWGNGLISVHNDAEVFAALIIIARQRGDISEVRRLMKLAHRVFYQDRRFISPDNE